MSRRNFCLNRISMAFIALCCLTTATQACGPDFPYRLLINRNTTLLTLPEGSFSFEVKKLVNRDQSLPIWHAPVRLPPRPIALSPSITIINQMRATNTVEAAAQIDSDGLSAAAHSYTLGAVAFKVKDIRASAYFQQVLAMPISEQGDWGLRAQYSLGRILMDDYGADDDLSTSATSSTHPKKAQLEQAIQAFEQVINNVKNGTKDPDQLALASLGQQARIYFWLGDVIKATRLYAQQTAQGDPNGALSLQFIASYLVNPNNFEKLKSSISDSLIRRLVILELFTRSSNLVLQDNDTSHSRSKKIINQIVTLLDENVKGDFDYSDRLAALAYRSGNYSIVTKLLKHAGESGLAWWLRAKMALRDGDIKLATIAYAKAAKAFPNDESWGEQRNDNFEWETLIPDCRISGERAILALNRGDYLQAFELLYRTKSIYWADVADIAERVLTASELKGFVDQFVSKPDSSSQPTQPAESNSDQLSADLKLRALLARKLMRAERYQEAQSYFDTASTKQAAQQYAEFINTAQQKKLPKPTRAKAYYQAAMILRNQGLDLIGYEMTPDYAIYQANYSYLPDAFSPAREKKKNSWISANEILRAQKTLPAQDNRFLHYRWKAMALAQHAADLLPAKSQAYAAVLCLAANWVIDRDAKSAQALYKQYISKGASYAWANQFGYQCPAPQFDALTP